MMALIEKVFNLCHADDVTNAISAGITATKTSLFTVITENLPTIFLVVAALMAVSLGLYLLRKIIRK